jgi:hypothetical protein
LFVGKKEQMGEEVEFNEEKKCLFFQGSTCKE